VRAPGDGGGPCCHAGAGDRSGRTSIGGGDDLATGDPAGDGDGSGIAVTAAGGLAGRTGDGEGAAALGLAAAGEPGSGVRAAVSEAGAAVGVGGDDGGWQPIAASTMAVVSRAMRSSIAPRVGMPGRLDVMSPPGSRDARAGARTMSSL